MPGELPWPVAYDGTVSDLRRLTRDELIGTIEPLIGSAPPREELPQENRSSAHSMLTSTGVALISSEIDVLMLAMDKLAVRTAPAVLTRSACAMTGRAQEDCLTAYGVRLAQQAFRRTLSDTETARLKGLFAGAGASREDDLLALQGLIRTVFLSPSFLYRPEIGKPRADQPGVATLDGREVAVRLAYLATLAPPDAALMTAASAGKLSDAAERGRQFDRLAATSAGSKAMTAFILDYLSAAETKVPQKSARYLTGLAPSFATDARNSATAAIQAVLTASKDSTLASLLTTTSYLSDAAVKPITSDATIEGTTTGDGQDASRAGLVMHPHVLASLTKENGASPFPIGLFIRQNLLCSTIPPAPAGAQANVRTNPPAGLSQREDFEYRTNAAPACTGCHASFSPLGYSFLPFDPVGRWMKRDSTGKEWNLSGSVPLTSGANLEFRTPTELMRNLSSLPQAFGCFAQSALQWAFGRRPVESDAPLLATLSDVSQQTRGGVTALFRTIVTSDGFINTALSR